MALGEPVELVAADGFRIAGRLFLPETRGGAAVQIHSAAGVKQEYYEPFAAYLAGRGFTVLTFDYRGVGASAPGHVGEIEAGMRDWAEQDASAALRFLQERKFRKILGIGHSFGGQSFAILPGNEAFAAVLAVASQSCYWRHWPGRMRAGMWLLTHVLLPGATRLFGYFPGAILDQGEDLPAGVALEWARWCRHPGYLVGALGLEARAARVTAPLRLCAMTDDPVYAPPAAARALLELYPNARRELKWIRPQDAGADRIGHFGFFRERFRETLWREAAEWLSGQAG